MRACLISIALASSSCTIDDIENMLSFETDPTNRSTRADDGPWSIPEVVEDLPGATRADVTPDGRRMVMMRHPDGGVADLYEATR